jgi:hypothetical protein
VRLESVRELKQELYEPLRVRGGLVPQETLEISVPAERATDVPRIQPSLALGIAPQSGGDFRLAVRVQHRDLLQSARLQAIHQAAHGEIDVRYVGRLTKLSTPETSRMRPLRPGLSVGHYAITAGTIGAFVRLRENGEPRLLSNNHVLADENRGAVGDEVLQPGQIDGGQRGEDRIGTLERFVELDASIANHVDAALATLDDPADVDPSLPGIGDVRYTLDPEDAHEVTKLGRTTGVTHGSVSAIEVDNVIVEFSTGPLRFDGQIEISGTAAGPFSFGGDSGSLVVATGDPRAVGLLFAGSDQGGPEGYGVAYANPITAVFEKLDVGGLL